ncbi:hypothetical protein KP001_05425 [Geomonas subterranea]|uniref:Uncharacterized protein n=1 Tax=Geomonas subterranea TaxID=2847989 RepID=A0ABX8LJ62_9BACT|nr:hypothetical protein [Geomonas subterranea]QXE91972.1 hypothetical protein KP001_05425 [Geomonas subterranea]QXM09935.1 hypothetical protein KP002_02070 [Geomonas subterranea]
MIIRPYSGRVYIADHTLPPLERVAENRMVAPAFAPWERVAEGRMVAPALALWERVAENRMVAPAPAPWERVAEGRMVAPALAPWERVAEGRVREVLKLKDAAGPRRRNPAASPFNNHRLLLIKCHAKQE